MPLIKRCCFSRNLRKGAIACGVWSLVNCVFSMGINITDIENIMYNDPDYYANKYYDDTTGLLAVSWFSLITSFMTAISSIALFVAVFKNNAKLTIPWMVMAAFQILFDAAGIIINILLDGFTKILIALFLIWIIFTLINIYCELCVLSHYQELKLGRGRRDDYLGGSSVRYRTEVQHVHIADGPINYMQSQHTVYSFHSQNLYDDENKDSGKPTQNGGSNGPTNGPTVLSNCNGRVLELRPVASMPANMDVRFDGNSYTGSIEMKIVDSVPVMVDRRNLTNYSGTQDMIPVIGKRPRRFRTVSESAVRQPMRNEASATQGVTSSLRNIAEHTRESVDCDAANVPSASNSSTSSSNSSGASSTPAGGADETGSLTKFVDS